MPSDEVCLFVSTEEDDLVSALIRRFSMCDWSHTGFYRLSDGWTFSAMCDGKGIDWRPPNPKAKILLLDAPRQQEAFEVALTRRGEPYDVKDIMGFVFDKNWISQGKAICDVLVFWSFIQINGPLLNHKYIPLEHLNPSHILVSPSVTARALAASI